MIISPGAVEQPVIGGSSPFLLKTVTLDDAAIKALPTMRFEIIPATEPALDYSTPPSELPMLVQATAWIVKANGSGYTNTNSETVLDLCYGSDYSTKLGRMMEIVANGLISDTIIFNNYLATALNATQPSWPMDFRIGPQFLGGANYNDNGVYAAIQGSVDSGDLTGGDPANTLKIEVVYRMMASA